MIRKIGIAMMTAALIFTTTPCFAAPQSYDFFKIVNLTVGVSEASINYKSVQMDEPAYISSGRTLVPLRFLGEALGAQVSWDSGSKKAKLSMPNSEIIVQTGSLSGIVDGKTVEMDVPAEVKKGHLFVPLRFISENLGAFVTYDPDTRNIMIRNADVSNWAVYDGQSDLKYKHPAAWPMTPLKDDPSKLTLLTPNGSTLQTYTSTEKPSVLEGEFRKSYEELGWSYETTYMDDENDPESGYEMVFTKYGKNGSLIYGHVDVDYYDGGSNIGEIVCSEDVDDVDAYILYLIVSS